MGLRKHHYKQSWGGDEIPVELFQILKDDDVKVLHSICQQIWKTQQWPQDWKSSVFIPIPKKGNAKECSNCCTIALISHASKIMLKILQAPLHSYISEWGGSEKRSRGNATFRPVFIGNSCRIKGGKGPLVPCGASLVTFFRW